jgi:hypothetical protein
MSENTEALSGNDDQESQIQEMLLSIDRTELSQIRAARLRLRDWCKVCGAKAKKLIELVMAQLTADEKKEISLIFVLVEIAKGLRNIGWSNEDIVFFMYTSGHDALTISCSLVFSGWVKKDILEGFVGALGEDHETIIQVGKILFPLVRPAGLHRKDQ